jgi:hypothetical protein
LNTPAKLGAYGLLLVATFSGAAAVGAAAGPIDVSPTTHSMTEENTMSSTPPAGGLLVSQDGYTFIPETRNLDGTTFAFVIQGPEGTPVTAFDVAHDRELHLIIASRDLQQYAHLHPRRDDQGRWSVELPQLAPGAYRAFADFQVSDGPALTIGIDLSVAGATAQPLPVQPTSTDTVDGYRVTLDSDPGRSDVATITVRRDGQVVTTAPYLGAAGHLVALRDGDLAYLHVHPLDHEARGPVHFSVTYPAAGAYALFFDFKTADGQVHTARFVVISSTPATAHPAAANHGSAH